MKSLIKTTIFTTLTTLFMLCQLSPAQTNNKANTDALSDRRFWEADLPGGNYIVAINSISSISMHSYLVNKTLIVHEVNVKTSGAGLVRFYTFEAPGESSDSNIAKNLIDRGKEIVEQGGSRAGVDTNTTVEKEYPLTTHAQTIEYKLFDKADLDQLYSSIKRSWKEGKGRKFTIK